MRKKTHLHAFTLMELLVVISILGILAIWFTKIDFSRLSQKQRVSIEATKIVSLIEEVRNNALIWKGVWINLTTPESWRIIIENNSSSWSLESTYLSWSYLPYARWNSPLPFSISNLECRTLEKPIAGSDPISTPLTLTFTWFLIGVSGCSDNTYKKISFDYWVGALTQNISVNTLSWVIEID